MRGGSIAVIQTTAKGMPVYDSRPKIKHFIASTS